MSLPYFNMYPTDFEADTCSMYFVAAKSPAPLCKIGVSKCPRKRLSTLSTASPYQLCLFTTIEFSNRLGAETAERIMHVALDDYRVNGEWFTIKGSDAVDLHKRLSEIISLRDCHPDDFVGIAQQTAFQIVGYAA